MADLTERTAGRARRMDAAALAGGAYYAPGYADYPPAYYAAVPRCRIEARWNPYWRGYERVRVCY